MLGARQIQSQDPVAAFRFHLVRIDLDRKGYCAVKSAGEPLAAMDARLLSVTDRLRAGNPDGSALDLNLQIRFADTGHFGNDDDVVALAKYIERLTSASHAPAVSPWTIERLREEGF